MYITWVPRDPLNVPLPSSGKLQFFYDITNSNIPSTKDENWVIKPLISGVISPDYAKVVTVALNWADFDSVKDACDSITDSSISMPYIIFVYPWIYTEDPFIIPQNTKILAYNATISANDNNVDFIQLNEECEIKWAIVVPPTFAKGVLMTGSNSKIKDGSIEWPCICAIETDASRCIIRDISIGFATLWLCSLSNIITISDVAFTSCWTAINTQTDAALLWSWLATVWCTIDLKTEDNSSVELTGSKLNISKFIISDWNNIRISSNSDKENDEALVNMQEFQVWVPEKWHESVFWEWDSYTRGMLAFIEIPGGIFADVSEAARSASWSTFSFPSNLVDSAIYVASSLTDWTDVLKHYWIKTNIETALDIWTWEVVIEYWNWLVWEEINWMVVDSWGSYYSHAKKYFQNTWFHQLRYDTEISKVNRVKNDPMLTWTDYYRVRFRIKTNIATIPVIEQFKLHSNSTELNADGFLEYFWKARWIDRLPRDAWLLEAANSSPGNQDLYIWDNLSVGRVENLFANWAIDRLWFMSPLPMSCDTSSKISFKRSVRTDDNSWWNIQWIVRWAWTNEWLNIYSSAAAAPTIAENQQDIILIDSAPLVKNTEKRYTVDLDISDMIARKDWWFPDTLWLTLERTWNAWSDTHWWDVGLIAISAEYKKRSEWGHI